jgi:hypothetical protein
LLSLVAASAAAVQSLSLAVEMVTVTEPACLLSVTLRREVIVRHVMHGSETMPASSVHKVDVVSMKAQ